MKKHTLLLISILILAFALRLYRIDNPIADWHSWRQADTASVTRNFVKLGYTPLIPRFDDISNIPSGIDNPQGYRMVEFPVYNSISFWVYNTFGIFGGTLEIWMRLTSVILSIGSIIFVYLLGRKYANVRVGLFSSFLYSVMPYAVYYSRVTLPEPSLVFFSLGMIWFFGMWCSSRAKSKKKKAISQAIAKSYVYYIIALLFAICALLIKPVAGFMFLPMAYLWYKQKLFSKQSVILGGSFFVLALVPLYMWREWIQQFPEGIPAWHWLLNGNNIRFRPSFFYWIGWKRLTELILGYSGVFIMIAGVISLIITKLKYRWFFVWWMVAMILYVVVFATGNVQHDYYQVVTVPIIVLLMGLGIDWLFSLVKRSLHTTGMALGIMIAIAGMLVFSWQTVKGYYWINNPVMIEAGQAVDRLLPKDAKVIAPYGGDTAFLYQTNRQGWPVGISIVDMIEKGATHYVNFTMDDPEIDYVRKAFTVLELTDRYIIVELKKPLGN